MIAYSPLCLLERQRTHLISVDADLMILEVGTVFGRFVKYTVNQPLVQTEVGLSLTVCLLSL